MIFPTLHCARPRLGRVLLGLLGAGLVLSANAAMAEVTPHGGMLRFPAASKDKIAFAYAGDLWVVDRDGGRATPLASPEGNEQRPRFSPDGRQIAFMGNYEGGADLYVVPVDGGPARRVTHHPSFEVLSQWTADGRLLFHSGMKGMPRGNAQLYTVSPEGGMPERLPVEYGAMGRISPDGRMLAFTPHSRDHRTWKRYRGGMATDIWLFDLRNGSSEKITDWEGTDTEPMWAGKTIYYVSDEGPSHRWNIWAYDTESKERRQVTKFRDFDVKTPSMGPGPNGQGEVVFQLGTGIHRLDCATGEVERIEVTIPGDRPRLRDQRVAVGEFVTGWDISSTGKRALVEMRGDIWSLPAEEGAAVNLTRTDDATERNPAWSPDGRWIAYFSDASGEYEILLQQSDGKGETKQLGKFGAPYKQYLSWSPKSDRLLYADKTGTLYLVDVPSGDRKKITQDPMGNTPSVSWSHDGAWFAYDQATDNLQGRIRLYEVASGKDTAVTSGVFPDGNPVFDRKGDFLYYTSQRDFSSPTYEDVGSTFVYDKTTTLLMVPLRKDVDLPQKPEEDVEKWDDEKKDDKSDDAEKDDEGDDEEEDEEDEEPLEIDLEGFEARAMRVDIESGNFGGVSVNDGGALLYVRFGGGDAELKIYDPAADEPEEKTVLSDVRRYAISADGKKLMVRKGPSFAILDAAADQKFEDPISVAGLEATVNPRHEWMEIFQDAWRMERDFFYDPNMHGVDWKGVRDKYAKMVEECTSRYDLAFVIREMISELNVGHAYYGGGDYDDEPQRNVGMLGVDFEREGNAYRIAKVYEGAPWDTDARSPLRLASGAVGEGDYVLAVDGVPVDPDRDPYAAFVGTAGKMTRLTVSSKPKLDDDAREVLVKPEGSEFNLRYRHWIETMRQKVAKASDGKVGYIYVPNTGINGQNDLFRQFYGQRDKQALIIDERWNGGGQIPTRFVELLNRPITNYWATRDGEKNTFPWPYDAHQGPKCMLINGLAGSGGDAFPAYFKMAGLGPLIGERTWGGLVGISGGIPLLDGAGVTSPSFAFYEKDGTWGIEGHGVDPDIEVVADPALLAKGQDPQLERAVQWCLDEIRRNPYEMPPVPRYPDRSGMGIPETDH